MIKHLTCCCSSDQHDWFQCEALLRPAECSEQVCIEALRRHQLVQRSVDVSVSGCLGRHWWSYSSTRWKSGRKMPWWWLLLALSCMPQRPNEMRRVFHRWGRLWFERCIAEGNEVEHPLSLRSWAGLGRFREFGQEAQEYLLLVSRRMTLFINILPHSKTLRSPSAKDIQLVVVN